MAQKVALASVERDGENGSIITVAMAFLTQTKPKIIQMDIDISNPDELLQVENFINQTWKKVDVLIHNAGSLLHKPFTQITSEEFQNIYKVNVFAVAELTKILENENQEQMKSSFMELKKMLGSGSASAKTATIITNSLMSGK